MAKLRNKILLILPSTMNGVDGGIVLMRSLLEHIPADELCFIAFEEPGVMMPEWMKHFPSLVLRSVAYNRLLRGLATKTPFKKGYLHYAYSAYPASQADAAVAFATSEKVKKLWVYAAGAAIRLGAELSIRLRLPMHVSLHDDINAYYGKDLVRLIEPHFKSLLQRSQTTDVATMELRDYYNQKYNVALAAKELIFAPAPKQFPTHPTIGLQPEKIAFAGNIWCADTFASFCEGIEILNQWRAAKRLVAVSLTIYGSRDLPSCLNRFQFVSYGGCISPDEITGKLNQYDILYAPMSFDERLSNISRFSKPSKLFTYMQSQIPIIAHGPQWAANVKFVAKQDVGKTITSNNPEEIASQLSEYFNDFSARTRHSSRALQLSTTEFQSEKIIEEFLNYLDSSI